MIPSSALVAISYWVGFKYLGRAVAGGGHRATCTEHAAAVFMYDIVEVNKAMFGKRPCNGE